MDISDLVNITARGWAIPVLSAMAEGIPGRQAVLLRETGAGRTALRQSLDHLIAQGLLQRNPGHGHPLRAEFILTPKGRAMADLAHRLRPLAGPQSRQALLRKTWTLPVLASAAAPVHFGAMRARLPGISDRALSLSLKSLQAAEWLRRDLVEAAPVPRPIYVAQGEGLMLGRTLQDALARAQMNG